MIVRENGLRIHYGKYMRNLAFCTVLIYVYEEPGNVYNRYFHSSVGQFSNMRIYISFSTDFYRFNMLLQITLITV